MKILRDDFAHSKQESLITCSLAFLATQSDEKKLEFEKGNTQPYAMAPN